MFPGSFIWKRISDRWLIGNVASTMFALSSVAIVGMTAIWLARLQTQDDGVLNRVLLGTAGVLASVSIFFLWGGMWRYWIRLDPSNRVARCLWFFLLLFGFWYGAILYYLCVYLPTKRGVEMEIPGRV